MKEVLRHPSLIEQESAKIYGRIDSIVDRFGYVLEEKNGKKPWKKVAVSLDSGNKENGDVITASVHSGKVKGEVKLIYEKLEADGRLGKVELAFRKNGGFEKKAIRGISANGSYSMERIFTTRELDVKELDQVHDLLDMMEIKLNNPQEAVSATSVDRVFPKHRHLIKLKHGQH